MSNRETHTGGKKREMVTGSGEKQGGGKKALFLVVLAGTVALAGAGFYMKKAKNTKAVVAERGVEETGLHSDVLSIPVSEIGIVATFYQATVGDVPVRFFVMKSSDGVIRSALDTCDTCASKMKGYRQEGDFMVCNNCDQRFPSEKINVLRGGCNPVPLDNRVEGDTVKIRVADIQQGVRYFNFGR